jgi:hypothetical protein
MTSMQVCTTTLTIQLEELLATLFKTGKSKKETLLSIALLVFMEEIIITGQEVEALMITHIFNLSNNLRNKVTSLKHQVLKYVVVNTHKQHFMIQATLQ